MCGYLSTKYVCVSLLSTNIHTLIVVMWINGLISSVVAIAKTILNYNDIQHISDIGYISWADAWTDAKIITVAVDSH